MTTIFERVKTALDSLTPAVPYGLGRYLSTEPLPDQYIVYHLIDGNPEAHADNVETHRTYRVQVSIFSRAGLAVLPAVDAAMLGQGFTRGSEAQINGDEDTQHYGIAKDYFYLETVQ